MAQKKTEPAPEDDHITEKKRGTRIDNAPPDLYDPNEPRLGRRESEPHSIEVTYLHDVLTTNFPKGRTLWDLHHYFLGTKEVLKGKKIDIQFDVSFFKDWTFPHTLSSYEARDHGNKIPDLAINVLSKSTWSNDLSEKADTCKNLGIPVYVVFSPFKVSSKLYHPPFLRAFILKEDGEYIQKDLRDITLEEGGTINKEKIIHLHDKLPFSLGLMLLKQKHEGEKSLYRMVLIDRSKQKIFPTQLEDTINQLEQKDKEIGRLKEQLK